MRKYLLDTNIILVDPNCIATLSDNGQNQIIITLRLLRELDNLKRKQEEGLKGQIRETINSIKSNYNLITFIDDRGTKEQYYDDALLTYLTKNPDVTLITNDKLLLLSAKALGLQAEEYQQSQMLYLPQSFGTMKDVDEIPVNQFIVEEGKLYRKREEGLQEIDLNQNVFNISPKNLEQAALFNVLLDPAIPLVAVTGQAGAGKNLCALAAGLEQIIETRTYSSLKVARAPIPSGHDIGFLPGNIDEKLNPWQRGLLDNLAFLLNNMETDSIEFFKSRYIDILSTTHIKGASIPNSYIIIDEAQDLTIKEIKMLITRAAINTKIVLLGDVKQISIPYLSEKYNGLSHVIRNFYGSKLFSYIELKSSVRSRLAQEAVERL